MNARLYDPILHTFLSPDALIADPSNPQNYNRYAYALNNPLMYVDYDGNEPITAAVLITAAIIGAVIGGVTYVGLSLYNGTEITWGGLAKSILVGAISGMASAGIGNIISSANTAICAATQTLTQTQINLMLMIPQALMHGIAQGIIQGVSGGNAGQSFVTAAISSIATGGFGMTTGSFGQSIAGKALFGSVAGGLTSRLQGGNFWEGAAIGLTVSLLNHAGEKLFEPMVMRAELARKYPGLCKVLSKLKSYVKNNADVMKSFTENSGYSTSKTLSLLSLKNLLNLVLVGDSSGEWGEFKSAWPGLDFDPKHIHIRADLVTGLDNGGYKDSLGNSESVFGTSFFTAVTVLHELVHYGRFWNGLTQYITIKNITNYEAGQVFETNAFGRIQGISGSTQSANNNGW